MNQQNTSLDLSCRSHNDMSEEVSVARYEFVEIMDWFAMRPLLLRSNILLWMIVFKDGLSHTCTHKDKQTHGNYISLKNVEFII